MTAVLEAPAGVQRPRIAHVPEFASGAGREAVELAAAAGLLLDPWQAYVLEQSLGEAPDGTWAATEVGLVVPRQNGKDAVLEARELAALFLFDEMLVVHSAHHFKTAKEHFLRLLGLIEGCPDLMRQVSRVHRSHGEEGITLKSGARMLFFTRTKGGGRGLSAPLLIFNEAMMLPEMALGALLPTQATFPNRQRWFAGSAVDQFVHEDGVVLARVRERGIAGEDPRLAYFEWSVDAESPDALDRRAVIDRGEWRAANPGFGIRIPEAAIEDELSSLDRRTFAVERLGVGDWPPTSAEAESAFDLTVWDALTDAGFSSAGLMPALAYDVSPDRSWSSVAAAFRGADGRLHAEVVEHRKGTDWVAGRVAELRERHEPLVVMCAGSSPAESLVFQCNEAGVDVEVVSVPDHAKACGHLADLVATRGVAHRGSDELRSAVAGAKAKPLGDQWLWSRRLSGKVVISPLVAVTLALWGQATLGWDPDAEVTIW